MIKKSPQLFLLFFSLCIFLQKMIEKTMTSEYLEVNSELKIHLRQGDDIKEENIIL